MRCGIERKRTIWQFVIIKNNSSVLLFTMSHASVLLFTINFCITCRKVVWKVVTRLSPRGSSVSLTMLWQNSWSITVLTPEKVSSICKLLLVLVGYRTPETLAVWAHFLKPRRELKIRRAAECFQLPTANFCINFISLKYAIIFKSIELNLLNLSWFYFSDYCSDYLLSFDFQKITTRHSVM